MNGKKGDSMITHLFKDPVFTLAVDELVQKHGCHTVVLYGSRARGDYTEDSDYDLVGFREDGNKLRDARLIEGKFLDAAIYPLSDVVGKEQDFLRIRGGVLLVEKGTFGRDLLAELNRIFEQGPKPLPEDELQTIRAWIQKMLTRMTRGDIEGNYRRAWLQYDLLESYFLLRKKWYLGPKESFRWLSIHDPTAYTLFERALKPDSKWDDLHALAESVLTAG